MSGSSAQINLNIFKKIPSVQSLLVSLWSLSGIILLGTEEHNVYDDLNMCPVLFQ